MPVRRRISTRIQAGNEAHPAFCTKGTESLLRLKRQKRCAGNSTPCSAGMRMGWSILPPPLYVCHGVTLNFSTQYFLEHEFQSGG